MLPHQGTGELNDPASRPSGLDVLLGRQKASIEQEPSTRDDPGHDP